MSSDFMDMFSAQAAAYARYRPTYPAELFDFVAAAAPARRRAWDCATGNGQAAVRLVERFERVIATDASREQIEQAAPHERIDFQVATAEASELEASSVDAVTVATAIHWFRLDAFVTEARRVLRPDGVLVFWTYSWSETEPAVKDVTTRYARDIIGDFWADEVQAAWGGYGDMEVDMPELEVPTFEVRASWTADELLGYLRTWSATQTFARAHGEDPTLQIESDLRDAYGAAERVEIRWPLALRAFRNA